MTSQAVQATAHLRRHHQHTLREEFRSTRMIKLKLRPIPEVSRGLCDGCECSCCTYVDCVADVSSKSSDQVVYTDQASSQTHDTGRASTGRASVRRRLADGRSEYESGWSHNIWN